MRCRKLIWFPVVLAFSLWVTACAPSAVNPVQTEDVEATIVAKVEATLIADAVNVEQKVQTTLTAIAEETQTAIALLSTSTPTVEPTSPPNPTDTPVPSPTATPTDIPEPTPTLTATEVAYRVSSAANLRSGPGTNYGVTGALQAGESITILARTEDGTWFQIKTETGAEAWLAAFLVESQPDAATVPVAAVIPETPTPAPTTPVAVAEQASPVQETSPRLDISFLNPHYNCDRGSDNVRTRYFQIDLFISNTSNQTVIAPWEPTRWFIASGESSRESTEMLQWCNRFSGCYPQPDVLPGSSEGWTWVTGRVELYEWVQAVEWEYNGQLYRQEFENNAINRAEWNYRACQ